MFETGFSTLGCGFYEFCYVLFDFCVLSDPGCDFYTRFGFIALLKAAGHLGFSADSIGVRKWPGPAKSGGNPKSGCRAVRSWRIK